MSGTDYEVQADPCLQSTMPAGDDPMTVWVRAASHLASGGNTKACDDLGSVVGMGQRCLHCNPIRYFVCKNTNPEAHGVTSARLHDGHQHGGRRKNLLNVKRSPPIHNSADVYQDFLSDPLWMYEMPTSAHWHFLHMQGSPPMSTQRVVQEEIKRMHFTQMQADLRHGINLGAACNPYRALVPRLVLSD